MATKKLGRPEGRFTQHRRFDHLLEALRQRPKGMTVYEMAAHIDVTPRTIRRYLHEVEREFDLVQEREHGGSVGRWRLHSSELPRKVSLRRTQAFALLAARRVFEPFRGTALYDEIELAHKSLFSVAQRAGRGPNDGVADARLEQRFLYLPFAPKDYASKTEELDDLFQAVSDLRPLSLRYQSLRKSQEESIVIHPYAMVWHRDSIYCVGLHVAEGEVRTFLLDRMRDTQPATVERFTLPADFSVDDYFQGELGVWRSDKRHKVVIEFDAQAAPYVRMRRIHPSQRLSVVAGGGLRVTLKLGDLRQLTSFILEWGARVRVLEPAELVEAVRTELAGALAHYESAPRAPRPKR